MGDAPSYLSWRLKVSNLNIFHQERMRDGQGSRGGAVVRALASHQCGLGSIPGTGVMCGLSLLLILSLLPEIFL